MEKDILTVAFNAYTGYEIGAGHIMRCIALAKVMTQKVNAEIHFVTNSDSRILMETGFSIERVSPDASYKEIRDIFLSIKPRIIIYDVLNASQEYIAETALPGTLIVIFDYYNRTGKLTAGDLVFNFHHSQGMEQFVEARFFEGMEYGILRDEFYQQISCPETTKGRRNILLTFGNSDPFNITEMILRYLLTYTCSGLKFHVILGEHYKNKQNIYDLSKNSCNIEVYERVNNMPQLMTQMDVAFVSGGVTLYEIAHMRVPAIIVCAHIYAFELGVYLQQRGCAINLGFHHRIKKKMIHKVMDELIFTDRLSFMRDKLSSIRINGASLISDLLIEEATNRGSI